MILFLYTILLVMKSKKKKRLNKFANSRGILWMTNNNTQYIVHSILT